MREAIMSTLLKSGYYPSPCGWWSKTGVYSDGNIPKISKNKWQNYQTMIAHGPGAYGWITDRNTSKSIQSHNELSIAKYAKGMKDPSHLPLSHGVILNSNEALATRLGFAYKANQPILFQEYEKRFGIHLLKNEPVGKILKDLEDRGFISIGEDHFVPTILGETFHEEIISKYFHERIGNFHESICKR
jgi:oxygen-independent coproporphyrinogen-3 oxidase